jgi:hypothetical protein
MFSSYLYVRVFVIYTLRDLVKDFLKLGINIMPL